MNTKTDVTEKLVAIKNNQAGRKVSVRNAITNDTKTVMKRSLHAMIMVLTTNLMMSVVKAIARRKT